MKLPTLILFLLLLSPAFGQDTSTVIIPSFDDAYCQTIKKLESGQTDIDYRVFRESFIESKQFIIASGKTAQFDSLKKEMYVQMGNHNYSALLRLTKAMLSIDYTSMLAHKILQQTYKQLGDTLNRKKYHDIEFGLLNSIVKNGDGKTCETAWPVIQVSEEYFILDMVGASVKKQSVDNKDGFCDKMEVNTENGKKTYYFEITKVFQGYDKLKTK